MIERAPHFLLLSEALMPASTARPESGRWQFRLQSPDGRDQLLASDEEPACEQDRLALLAVVRGLEALDQPSRVTLVTTNRYVRRGLRYGIEQWKDNGWTWERFGQMTAVKNADLWRRVDRALQYHQVNCRQWRVDPAHTAPIPTADRSRASLSAGVRRFCARRGARLAAAVKQWWDGIRDRLPRPWPPYAVD